MKILTTLAMVSFLILGCGDDNGSKSSDGRFQSSGSSVLMISGVDSATIGNNVTLTEYAYGRQDLTGHPESLIATTSGLLQSVLGNPSSTTDGAIFVITSFGLSIRFNVGSQSFLYLMSCQNMGVPANCPSISMNTSAKTVTFSNTMAQPSTSSSSSAQGPISINGTVRW